MFKLLTTSLFFALTLASESGSSSASGESPSSTYATQLRDDVDCNYYYSTFDTTHFAYAIGQCTQISILNTQFMNATCLDTEHLQVNIFDAAGCSGSPASNNIYTSNNATFYCGGVNAYAELEINLGKCPAKYSVYSAINTCTNVSSHLWSSVYCTATSGQIQYYMENTCSDSSYYSYNHFNTSCHYLFTTTGEATLEVYGELITCNNPSTTTTTTTKSTTSSANIYDVKNTFFLIMMLFAALQL